MLIRPSLQGFSAGQDNLDHMWLPLGLLSLPNWSGLGRKAQLAKDHIKNSSFADMGIAKTSRL